jgi:hypothetical protein
MEDLGKSRSMAPGNEFLALRPQDPGKIGEEGLKPEAGPPGTALARASLRWEPEACKSKEALSPGLAAGHRGACG